MSSQRDPSFHALYVQARPAVPPGEKTMQQYERFATACLGFVLQHDLDFRRRFLKTICAYKGLLAARGFKITLEPDKRGDLALESDDETFLVEAKINAPLQTNQNPLHKTFFSPGGYGHHIIKHYAGKGTYVILWQKDRVDKKPWFAKPRCVVRHWNELLAIHNGRPLVDDLFQSLSSFQVRCFAAFNPMTNAQKLASKAADACRIHAVLEAVAEYLRLNLRLPKIKDESDFQSGSYIGCEISRKGADRKWVNFIAPTGKGSVDRISWFGYGDNHLSVGFYCDSAKVGEVQNALKKCASQFGKVKIIDDTYVRIESADGHPKAGDKEWFMAIYERLCEHIDSVGKTIHRIKPATRKSLPAAS